MKEQQIQKQIVEYLEGKGFYVIKIVRANKSGVADLACCCDGRFFALEVKAKGKKSNVTKLQQFHLDLVRMSGGVAAVVDCVEDVKELGL